MSCSPLFSTLFSLFLSAANVQHLAMALLHNLWQGAIVALVLVGLLRLIPARRANLRYVVCLTAMTLVLICGLATWGWLNIRAGYLASNATAVEKLASLGEAASSRLNWPTWLVALWLAGVVFMLVRLAISFCQLRQLKQNSRDAPSDIQALVQRVASRCGLTKPLRALVNENLSSAAVVGVLRPIVFLPASMVTGLTETQLEAVIAHEIAHIRRFDPVVNFCQMLIEALLFFNPAVAWIGRQIRMEREACCDAVGVTATGDQSVYLDTLALWAERMKGSAAPRGALAFSHHQKSARQKSNLLDRVRRVLFPDFVPATRFSPLSTVFLFAIGMTLLATLWQGTMVAVALADELLPHEQVVEALREKRDEYDGRPAPLAKENESAGPMTVKLKLETEDGQPTTSRVWVHYETHTEKEGHSRGRSSCAASIEAGETEASFDVVEGWANVFVTCDDYVSFVLRDIRPDANGVANIVATLRKGYPGRVKVVSEEGEPVANAKVRLSKVLHYKVERQLSANSKSTRTGGTGVVAGELTTDTNGIVIVEHATEQPLFQVRVTAPGFESRSEKPFGISEGDPHRVVLKRALKVVGHVTDSKGVSLKDVKFHMASSYKKAAGENHRSGSMLFIRKEFGETLAVSSEDGDFSIDNLESDWVYNLIADAGDRGLMMCFDVRPGDEPVAITIGGPVNISGTVSGEMDRLKDKDEYVLRYGVSLVSTDGTSNGDSSGRLKLNVVDGKAAFELKNVLPGKYRFFDSKQGHYSFFVNGLEVTESVDDLAIVVPPRETRKAPVKSIARSVRLEFESGSGVADFQGRISVSSRVENGDSYFDRPVDVVDGVAQFKVNAPSKLSVELMDAPGFIFDEGVRQTQLVVDAGDGGFEENLEVFPAGAVVGEINVGKRREGAWLGVFGWMDYGNRSSSVSDECDVDGRFHLSNVPYGATFRLIARHGAYCESIESVDVDEQTPLVEKAITLDDGPSLRGMIVDSEGEPFAHRPVLLRLLLKKNSNHFSIGRVSTNRDGEFDFGPINTSLGTHMVEIKTDGQQAQKLVAVEECESPLKIELDRGLIIEGRLVNEVTGDPVPNAEVYAMPRDFRLDAIYAYEADSKTDENGVFEITNLIDGEYELNTRVLNGRVVNREYVPAGKQDVLLRISTEPEPPLAAGRANPDIPGTH